MTFFESIKTCVTKKYSKGNGRASRSELWYFVLFYIGVIFISIKIAPLIEQMSQTEFTAQSDYEGYALVFSFVFGLSLLLPFINVHIRRLNDIGQPGSSWMGGLGALFITAGILSRLITVEIGEFIAWGIYVLYGIIFILCIKPGDQKDNKYGKNIYKKSKK
jgi:uncharacterized membrane protein YhaH (DUF805 family)